MEGIKTDIKALFLEREDCDAGTVQQLRNGLSQGATQYKALRSAVASLAQIARQPVILASGGK